MAENVDFEQKKCRLLVFPQRWPKLTPPPPSVFRPEFRKWGLRTGGPRSGPPLAGPDPPREGGPKPPSRDLRGGSKTPLSGPPTGTHFGSPMGGISKAPFQSSPTRVWEDSFDPFRVMSQFRHLALVLVRRRAIGVHKGRHIGIGLCQYQETPIFIGVPHLWPTNVGNTILI